MTIAPRRVVVTGMGAVTPLGLTLKESWKALTRNETGVTSLEKALDCQGLPTETHLRELDFARTLSCQVAAPVRDFPHDPRTSRFVQMALRAGEEAITQAHLSREWWHSSPEHQDRTGVSVGSGMSGVREIVEASRTVNEMGIRKLSPHFVPKVLANSAAGRLSTQYSLRGPNTSASTACAAGAHAIGDAMRCIQYGNADIMLAGGAEACIDPLSMAGFCRLRALSTKFADTPAEASRPFDNQRDGFVMGEGAAILVLEDLEHASSRGAPIIAELCGYGLSGDAYHVTAPDPAGRGAGRAMHMALAQACIGAEEVDYVNAHATSTPKGDEIEARVVDRILTCVRSRSTDLYVSSTKGATGHMLGAAGAIEAAFSVAALSTGCIPPTRNLHETEEMIFRHVRDKKSMGDLRVCMSNSFGFSGTNASLLFRTYSESISK